MQQERNNGTVQAERRRCKEKDKKNIKEQTRREKTNKLKGLSNPVLKKEHAKKQKSAKALSAHTTAVEHKDINPHKGSLNKKNQKDRSTQIKTWHDNQNISIDWPREVFVETNELHQSYR